jgi:hypothetical protein
LRVWYPQLSARPYQDFSVHKTARWTGDLALMLGGIYDVMAETSEQWQPLTPPAAEPLAPSGYVPPGSMYYTVFAGHNPSLPRAVVFHDSFLLASDERINAKDLPTRAFPPPAQTLRPRLLLAEQFSRSAFTWQYGFDSKLVEAEMPDVVIEEHLERQLVIYPPGGDVPAPPAAP